MYRRVKDMCEEMGIPREMRFRLCHRKGTVCFKYNNAKNSPFMAEESEFKKMLKTLEGRFVVLLLFLLIMAGTVTAKAETITDSKALGGLSLYIEQYVESGRRLYAEEDLKLLSAVMELENGGGNDRCLLLTGSVLLNRAYYCSWCPNTIKECVYQGYHSAGAQQYASHTVENLYTVKVSDRVTALARQLLIFGVACPHNVVYQSRYAHQGSGNYEVIGGEYFAYE